MSTLDLDQPGELNGKQEQNWEPDPNQNFAADFLAWRFILHPTAVKALTHVATQIPNSELVVCSHVCIIYFFHPFPLNHNLLYWLPEY